MRKLLQFLNWFVPVSILVAIAALFIIALY